LVAPALECLGLLRRHEKTAAQQVSALVSEAKMRDTFREAHRIKKVDSEASALTLLMLTGTNFSEGLDIDWPAFLRDRDELVELVDAKLDEFDSPDNLYSIVEAQSANRPRLDALAGRIVSKRLEQHRLGALDLVQVIDALPRYLGCIPGLERAFMLELGSCGILEIFDVANLGKNALRILLELLTSEEEDVKNAALDFARRYLASLDEPQWDAAISTGTLDFQLASVAANARGGISEYSGVLSTALSVAIAKLLSVNEPSARARWFRAASWLTSSARQTLYRSLRDQLLPSAALDMAGLLSAAGEGFISEAHIDEAPDAFSRHVVLTLLENSTGLDWLDTHADAIAPVIRQAKPETRSFISEQLARYFVGAAEDQKRQATFQNLSRTWDLPLAVVLRDGE
jgi:hypothetical protein